MSKNEVKIYTKGGDKGKTSLIGGRRVFKYDLQVEAYGSIDELKSYTGLVYDFVDELNCKKTLLIILENLFVIESIVASDGEESKLTLPELTPKNIKFLEEEIDRMTKSLVPLHSFILPGGHPLISHCHIARSICRRSERAYLRFSEAHGVEELVAQYLNRLSDYFFTLARFAAKSLDIDELLWDPEKVKSRSV